MGGPQSPDEDGRGFPYTTILIGRDPDDSKSHQATNRYIVGVSGAQLLSVTYGAEYEDSPGR